MERITFQAAFIFAIAKPSGSYLRGESIRARQHWHGFAAEISGDPALPGPFELETCDRA